MNRILHWLTVKLSRSSSTDATEESDADDDELGVSEEDDSGGPAIYGDPDGDTQPDLPIIKDPAETSDNSESYDPYNSGTFKALKK